jgi:glucan-binding YG repeat protein
MEQEKLVKDIADLQDVARKQREQLVKTNQELTALKEAITMLHNQTNNTIDLPYADWAVEERSQSPEINELAAALAKAQAEMKVAKKDSEAFGNRKYSSIEDLHAAAQSAINKNGLSIHYKVDVDQDKSEMLITKLLHSSGQFSSMRMYLNVEKDTANKNYQQARGGAISYLKRYAYGCLTGVITGDYDEIENQPIPTQTQQAYKPNPFK